MVPTWGNMAPNLAGVAIFGTPIEGRRGRGENLCFRFGGGEIEKFIIRQPPIGEKDSENSWISDGLPSSTHGATKYLKIRNTEANWANREIPWRLM